MSTPREGAQPSAAAGEPLAWQRELDIAIADIETRLSHPRRRVTDVQPTLPLLGQPEITSEMLDEIAWRVSELLRREGGQPPASKTMAGFISETVTLHPFASESDTAPPSRSVPPPPAVEPRQLPHGVAMAIRIRRPFFRWPFRRRRRKRSMITFADYRIS